MKFFGKGTTTRFIEDPEEKRDKLVKVKTITFFGLLVSRLLHLFLMMEYLSNILKLRFFQIVFQGQHTQQVQHLLLWIHFLRVSQLSRGVCFYVFNTPIP